VGVVFGDFTLFGCSVGLVFWEVGFVAGFAGCWVLVLVVDVLGIWWVL